MSQTHFPVPKWLRSPVAIILVVAVGAIMSIQLVLWLRRPMFHNVFGRSDHMLLSQWVVEPPHTDRQGNAAIADYRLNLLVVFLTGSSGIEPSRFWGPHIVADGATFPAECAEDSVDFHVPRVQNVLMIFEADGSRRERPLAPGEAERIHTLLDDRPSDMRQLLDDIPTDEHTADGTGETPVAPN